MVFFVDLYAGAATQNMKTWWEALILFYVLIGEFVVLTLSVGCQERTRDVEFLVPLNSALICSLII